MRSIPRSTKPVPHPLIVELFHNLTRLRADKSVHKEHCPGMVVARRMVIIRILWMAGYVWGFQTAIKGWICSCRPFFKGNIFIVLFPLFSLTEIGGFLNSVSPCITRRYLTFSLWSWVSVLVFVIGWLQVSNRDQWRCASIWRRNLGTPGDQTERTH